MAVVVVGSVNVDMVVRVERLPAPGETVLGGSFEEHDGGKGANLAVAAARFAAQVRLVGAVGADALGERATDALTIEGVDVSGVSRLEREVTGVALIVVAADGENQIAVAPGANGRLDAMMVEQAVAGRVSDRDVVVVGFEVPDGAVVAAARAAAGTGARLIVSPAPVRPLPDGLVECAPLIVANAGEASSLTGEADPEGAARAMAARTRAPAIVTLGASGAILADGDRAARLPTYAVDAVDTTGAGDAFVGSLAAELANGASLNEAARLAAAAAALATTAVGARAGMAPRDAARGLADGAVR